MASTFVLTLSIFALTFILYVLLPLARNIRHAKASGLPYVVVPYYAYNRVISMVMGRTLLRLADRFLPEPTATSWRRLTTGNWAWKLKHAPFARLGSDTFLTVAPGGIVLNTADADVIDEVMARPIDFPKPSHLYRTVNVYGENVVSSEGPTWRHHRRLMSPAFSEKTNRLVWTQTLDGCHAMLNGWLERNRTRDKTIRTLANDTMRLSLGVIARAGLGQEMDWPSTTSKSAENQDEVLSNGHKMTFIASLTYLLRNILYVIVLPTWFQKRGPVKAARKAYQSYLEWGQYMEELIIAKRSTRVDKSERATVDLLSQLVKQQDIKDAGLADQAGLTDSEIMGNLFVMVLAGHETSASSIHFCLVLLALYPEVQVGVQKELDEIFGERRDDCSQWDYERDLPRLLNSSLAAVLNEELRLIGSVVNIPKLTTAPRRLAVDGRDIMLPANTILRLCVPSVHHNPRFWAATQITDSRDSVDLTELKPQRWLQMSNCAKEMTDGPFVPRAGAYVPFSANARACLGRRFAQVEILAALALIMSRCSVELAVDEWATDAEVDAMNIEDKESLWEKAAEKTSWTLQNKMVCVITLQLRGAHVPVRVVKRGEERFAGLARFESEADISPDR